MRDQSSLSLGLKVSEQKVNVLRLMNCRIVCFQVMLHSYRPSRVLSR